MSRIYFFCFIYKTQGKVKISSPERYSDESLDNVIVRGINESLTDVLQKNRENLDEDFDLDLETIIAEKLKLTNNTSPDTNFETYAYFYNYLNKNFDKNNIDEILSDDILAISDDTITVSLDNPMDRTFD